MRFINTDPRLSEFTDIELKDVSVAISIQIDEIERLLDFKMKYYETNGDDVPRFRERLENLRTVYTQLVNAQVKKAFDRQVASN